MNTNLAFTDATITAASTTPTLYLAPRTLPINDAVNDDRWRSWSRRLGDAVARVARTIRSLGPYAAIELILPGGTLIALAIWTYRQRRAARANASPVSTVAEPAVRRGSICCGTPCPQS